jgi:hypothetical protein
MQGAPWRGFRKTKRMEVRQEKFSRAVEKENPKPKGEESHIEHREIVMRGKRK